MVSGSGKAVSIFTWEETEFGKISAKLKLRPPETEFEKGIAQFGHLRIEVTMLMVTAILTINVYLQHPILTPFSFPLLLPSD